MNRAFVFGMLALWAAAPGAAAQDAAAPAADKVRAFEIVKQNIDLEVAPDGQSWSETELSLRPLTSQGVQALQQRTLSYTAGYQTLSLRAYTLKKDGTKLEVAQDAILQGHGETTSPGYADTRTMTVVFPNLEIGDQAVLVSTMVQSTPWFANTVAALQTFSREVVVRQAHIALTTRGDDAAYRIVASGLEAAPSVTLNGKTRRVWTFHNDVARQPEPQEVFEYADVPRLEVSNLADYGKVAKIYADLFQDRAEPTPEIKALADKLTEGVKGRRAQAKLLYDWVATHIEYVNIVLGAGGFLPHKAADVLKNGHGDCKDHVMLLEALLAAKGIPSSAVLIRVGASQYKMPDVASPFLFDHLITYVPEFKLFLDSTARYAPFGELPFSDSGRPVVIVQSGAVAVTPADALHSGVTARADVKLNSDGSADGDMHLHATGTDAIETRAGLAQMLPANDTEYFRGLLGPGSDGRFERGQPDALDAAYDYAVHFHQGHAANFTRPGAVSPFLGFNGIRFSTLFAPDLPPERTLDYVCASGSYTKSVNLTFPAGVTVSSVPASQSLATGGVKLSLDYRQPDSAQVHVDVALTMDRKGPVCRAADYAKIRPVLSDMLDAMQAQILFKQDAAK